MTFSMAYLPVHPGEAMGFRAEPQSPRFSTRVQKMLETPVKEGKVEMLCL